MSEARYHCRRCRLKLAEPTENPRSAFCCRGCHRQFYDKHCLACERPMERKTGTQKTCGRRKCGNEYQSLKAHSMLGRYHPGPTLRSGSANPIEIGVPERVKGDRPCRIVAGQLTPDQLLLVTAGTGGPDCPFKFDSTLNRKHWIQPARTEITPSGDFADSEWSEVTSSDGVRCFVPVRDAANG